jgi:hypothetical protein
MNYVLFLIVVGTAYKPVVTVKSFKSEVGCLQAIEKLINVEKKAGVNINAFCVKD